MIYIGIDPGKGGALAYIMPDGLVNVIPYDESSYKFVLEAIASRKDPAMCCLEHVTAMPGQGVTSMFTFGQLFGWLQGMLQAFDIPYQLVRPQKWKREFGITGDKNTSIAVCKRLFPDVSLYRTDRCRKESPDLAEAILMAEYARRKL